MTTLFKAEINSYNVIVSYDGEDMSVVIDTAYGQIALELEQNWIDHLVDVCEDEWAEEDEKEYAVLQMLSVIKKTQAGKAFKGFSDAPDDNSFIVTGQRTEEQIKVARSTTIYQDIVTSIGQVNADKFCTEYTEKEGA